MSVAAEELRRQADELERQEREAAIIARCSAGDYIWSSSGRCSRRYHEFVTCPGEYGQPHYESYTDEYSMWQFCGACRGSGRVFVTHEIRCPEYDAPRPPKDPA